MATYALGKVGMNLRGNYDASATYHKLDVVTYGGSSYAALQTCTGVPVTNTEYWQMLCTGGAESYSTEEVCTGGIWVDGKPIYRKMVQFNSLTDGANNYREIGASGTIDTVVRYYGLKALPLIRLDFIGFPTYNIKCRKFGGTEYVFIQNPRNLFAGDFD